MERKVYTIDNLDCANCAAKIESKLNDHPQVEEAVITFATRQLRLTAENPDALIPELQALARTVEPDAEILPREGNDSPAPQAHHQGECSCGHHPHHDEDCCCGHDHHGGECACGHTHESEHSRQKAGHDHAHDHSHDEPESVRPLLAGAALFAVGLILEHAGLNWTSMAVCLGAYVLLGWEVIVKAFRNLKSGHVLDENFLMSVASLGAFFIGNAPEGVGVMLFYRIGEYFEEKAVARSRSQIMEAVDLRPDVVQLVEGESVREIPAAEAKVGDTLLVRPGDRIPLDGRILTGESRVDTAPITGEPVPVHVAPGTSVVSGCINGSGQLTMRVEKPLSESMVTRILDSVENAAASKPKIDRFITRFARVYTPVVVGLAAVIAVLPSLVTGNWSYWVYTALTFLVMSCPCALVLSVPLAFFAGIGAGSKKGILFKGGQSMEAMGKIKTVIVDKTGTVTQGNFQVQKQEGSPSLLEICACCEQQSTHPIAESIVSAAKKQGILLRQPEELEELAGRGIRARLDGKEVLCGNARLLREYGISFSETKEPGTQVLAAVDGVYQGYLLISDTIKPGAEPAVRALRDSGIETVMLTGDAEDAARAVAGAVGIREVHAGLLPHQKLERLQAIREEKGACMFVGDGINDAPVLAGADVGAAMGSGADAAIEAADVVFMTSDMEAIPQSLRIAKATAKIAWENVIFALAIKLAVMILGLTGFASMWMAVFADSGVAMLCVLNSIRMLYKK